MTPTTEAPAAAWRLEALAARVRSLSSEVHRHLERVNAVREGRLPSDAGDDATETVALRALVQTKAAIRPSSGPDAAKGGGTSPTSRARNRWGSSSTGLAPVRVGLLNDSDLDEGALAPAVAGFEPAIAVCDEANPDHSESGGALTPSAQLDSRSVDPPMRSGRSSARSRPTNASVFAGGLTAARFVLARALWDAGGECARVLARSAREASAGVKEAELRADVDAWLAAR